MKERFALLAAVLLLVGVVGTSAASTKKETGALTAEDNSITAKCPAGQRVVLGGMEAQFDDDQYSYIESLTRPTSRSLRVSSYVPSVNPTQLTVIATCKRQPRSREVVDTVELADEIEAPATARCPGDRRLVFGGFRGTLTGADEYVTTVAARARGGGARWQVTAVNDGSGPPGDLTALAYCGDAPKVKERSATETLAGFPDSATATARCKRSERLAFGGFDVNVPGIDDEYVTVTGLKRSGGRAWSVTALNDGAAPGNDVKAYAYCAKR